jgi:hypothetical protein
VLAVGAVDAAGSIPPSALAPVLVLGLAIGAVTEVEGGADEALEVEAAVDVELVPVPGNSGVDPTGAGMLVLIVGRRS